MITLHLTNLTHNSKTLPTIQNSHIPNNTFLAKITFHAQQALIREIWKYVRRVAWSPYILPVLAFLDRSGDCVVIFWCWYLVGFRFFCLEFGVRGFSGLAGGIIWFEWHFDEILWSEVMWFGGNIRMFHWWFALKWKPGSQKYYNEIFSNFLLFFIQMPNREVFMFDGKQVWWVLG